MQQVSHLHPKFNELQLKYGDPSLASVYGAGQIHSPKAMFIFMNPTARNITAKPDWKGIRAPWLGTKQVWNIFNTLGLLDEEIYNKILILKPIEWTEEFAYDVYSNIQRNGIYITNLAKCTQIDARPLNNRIFKDYLDLMYEEIKYIQPKRIVTFGNQVSSIVLGKNIKVSDYADIQGENLNIQNNILKIYPTYYPVGQGRRNLPKAVERIKNIMK